FSDSYFRNADLRGIDFRKAKLEGSSFADAKISGCYFDDGLSASEMAMSIAQGTRVRRNSAPDK
ncbi:pentapeptide repeat-containing protein, partial [bacterium]|nr:pentapeptide repeat-containing protein [bacterium]